MKDARNYTLTPHERAILERLRAPVGESEFTADDREHLLSLKARGLIVHAGLSFAIERRGVEALRRATA